MYERSLKPTDVIWQLGSHTGLITVSPHSSPSSPLIRASPLNEGESIGADHLYAAPFAHRQCHLPLAPRDVSSLDAGNGSGDEEQGLMGARARMIEEEGEEERQPRQSEEEAAWRSARST